MILWQSEKKEYNIRDEDRTTHFSLNLAVLCIDCDEVSSSIYKCPACGSSVLVNLANFFDKKRKTMYNKSFFVAGVQHHELDKVISDLDKGSILELVPEPENKYDSNAVAIKFNDTMLGYVPRKVSAEVSALFETESVIKCEIEELDEDKRPWERLYVTISTTEDSEELR